MHFLVDDFLLFCGLLKAEAGNRGSHRVPESFDCQGAGSEGACYLLPSTHWLKVLFYKWFLEINIIKISDTSTKNCKKYESIISVSCCDLYFTVFYQCKEQISCFIFLLVFLLSLILCAVDTVSVLVLIRRLRSSNNASFSLKWHIGSYRGLPACLYCMYFFKIVKLAWPDLYPWSLKSYSYNLVWSFANVTKTFSSEAGITDVKNTRSEQHWKWWSVLFFHQ